VDALALVLFFGLVALFALRAWKAEGRLAGRDRWALVTGFAVAVAAFAAASLLVNWVVVPTALWPAAVALLAGGVVGAALRWPELAWSAGMHRVRRPVGVGATLLSCAVVVGVAVA
jgi:hypothetical protein